MNRSLHFNARILITLSTGSSFLLLVNNFPEEIRQDALIRRHLCIPWEVVDVDDEVAISDLDVANDVEIEQMELHRSPHPPRDLRQEAKRRHLHILQMHGFQVIVIGSISHCQVRHLRERHRALGPVEVPLLHVG